MQRSMFAVLAAASVLPFARAADTESDRLATIFRPFETDLVTLSPDGIHVAYTERIDGNLILSIRDLGANKIVRTAIGADAADEFSGLREKRPASVTILRWVTDDRLVFNLNGQDVWSIAADGTDPKSLGNVNTFAGELLPPIEQPNRGDYTGAVIARSPLEEFERTNQPVYVAAIPRGEPFVYVQALMKERGLVRYEDVVYTDTGPEFYPRVQPNPSGTPRVVFKVDARTGEADEWGETPQSDFMLCDQQGYPRLVHAPQNMHNSRQVTRQFLYASAKGGKWKPLDELVKGDSAATFVDASQRAFADRSVPIAFDYDGKVLYFASNAKRDTYTIFGLDTTTWQRTEVEVAADGVDIIDPRANLSMVADTLVFDGWQRRLVGVRYNGRERMTRWLDGQLAAAQQRLDDADRTRHWEIVEWDRARKSLLVLGTSKAEPGVYCVYRPAEGTITEFMSRAPWLDEYARNPGGSFRFTTSGGVTLTGYLTAPRRSLLKRPPIVVLCHDGPWSRDLPTYDREAQALACMGFIVLQLNYRGSIGFGRHHLDALRESSDTLAIDDFVAALDRIVPQAADRRLVAIMGHGFGGYLALRAIQLQPDRFRCAVAIDAPTDLAVWVNEDAGTYTGEVRRSYFGDDSAKLRRASPAAHVDDLKKPVMIIQADANANLGGRAVAHAAIAHDPESMFLSLSANEAANLPQARAALFGKIRGFLNTNIYNYAVKIGAVKAVDDK